MKKWLVCFICMQLLTWNLAFAQEKENDLLKNTQNDILIVVSATVGGAILGLSTLSFSEQPANSINNVWGGAAIGLIVGVCYVAYNSAQKGQEELLGYQASESFSTSERSSWHSENSQFLAMQSVQFGTQFWQTSF